jgi:tripartite-type tricarboxylate transporter receptor subunit TctC
MINRRHLTAALAAAALALPAIGVAQTTTRIIVPFGAGGPIDVTTRVLAEAARGALGTVIIENRAGAGGNIGVAAAAKAPPDGLTIGVATTASHGINPWLFKTLPYDPVKDTAPITQMLRVPNVLVMNAEAATRLNINSVADLIAYAKRNPGKLNYGSGGNGSSGHLAGELFKNQAGVFAVHIPFNGGAPAQTALLGGQVDFNIDNLATAAANIRADHRPAQCCDARRTDPGRDPARLRDRHLVGPVRTGRHATGDRAQAQRRLHRSPAHARGEGPLRHADGRART